MDRQGETAEAGAEDSAGRQAGVTEKDAKGLIGKSEEE